MQTLNFRHLQGRRCIKGFSSSQCLIVGYVSRARKAEFLTSSMPCLATVSACQLSTAAAPWPPLKTCTDKVRKKRRLRTGRFSGWKQGFIICPEKLVEFHLWSKLVVPSAPYSSDKKTENLILQRLTVSCSLLHKVLSNSYFSLFRFFTSTALLGRLFQNITTPTVTSLLISSINVLVAGFGPLTFLPRVSRSMKNAPVSFYSIGTLIESSHILSQPLVH